MSNEEDCPKERQTLQERHSIACSLENEIYDLIKHTPSTTDSARESLEGFIKSKKLEVENEFRDEQAKDAKSKMSQICGVENNIEEATKDYERASSDTNDPTQLKLPYFVVCRQRLLKAGKQQRTQFIRELKAHELLRARALDGVRIHREFCNPILSSVDPKELIVLTKKQKEKIEKLLLGP
ncbi:uncharacterized protein [Euwallacea fornicatus]